MPSFPWLWAAIGALSAFFRSDRGTAFKRYGSTSTIFATYLLDPLLLLAYNAPTTEKLLPTVIVQIIGVSLIGTFQEEYFSCWASDCPRSSAPTPWITTRGVNKIITGKWKVFSHFHQA